MAGNNMQNTTGAKTNSFPKGMYKDTTDIYISEGLWTNAINAINNSHSGEVGAIGNEPSNEYCTKAPYTIIGFANIIETEWVVFSTNDIDSEIGIFDETKCKYTKIVSARCLNFKQTHLITAHVKTNYDCTRSVYWQDDLNPDRVMNLDKVPYICKPKTTNPCDGETCTDQLDCDAIRLHPLIQQPCLKLSKAKGSGQLNNGSYTAFIAYSENGIRLTDYSMPSVVQSLWQDTGIGGGLEFEITNLDPDYDEYELVILCVITQQAIAKKIGYYSTAQTQVTIDIIAGSLETVPTKYLPLKNVVYEKSKKMFVINDYLIRTSVTTQPYLNYQLLANKITAKWVAVEYNSNFYYNGGNSVGYLRDEVYAFFIRWIYNTGNRTASYHIPGRPSKATDMLAVSGDDVVSPTETKAWQVYDTSTKLVASGTTPDGGTIKFRGDMAYWESTERYPVKPAVWGPLCNQPIRHHKMPSNETMHIHNKAPGELIYVLGVEFYNIQHPIDEKGNPISDIVGYEILRGSREGNRSIVAKGLFTNMLEFDIQGDNDKNGLIQNYPYNDLGPDPFLTNQFSVLDLAGSENGNSGASSIASAEGGGGYNDDGNGKKTDGDKGKTEFVPTGGASYSTESTPKLDSFRKDIFAFHSVEGSFIRPALGGNHIKIYTEEIGTSKGRFVLAHKHPRFKFLTDGAMWSSLPVAIGMVIVEVLGKTTIRAGNSLGFSFLATADIMAQGNKETGAGSWISDLIGTNLLAAVSSGGQSINTGLIEGVLNITLGAAYYFPKAMNAYFTIVKNMNNYRDHVLQFNSHGFFNDYNSITNSAIPSGFQKCYRRAVVPNKAKYIGMHVQDFDNDFRINNVHRPKYICLKTTKDVPNPVAIDNSKVSLQDLYKNVPGNSEIHKYPFKSLTTNIVQYYGAIKVDFQNQYGQLDSITQIPVNSCVYNTKPLAGFANKTNVIFGGDIYINRYTEKNPYLFFNTWLMGEEDGFIFDYRAVVNGPIPRYFAAFYNFEAQDLAIKIKFKFIFPKITMTTPSDFYRFDQGQSLKSGLLIKKNAWFYLSYNGVRDFYTESELNMAFRDFGEDIQQKFYDVYGGSFNDINIMFRSDHISKPVYYKYDLSLSVSKLFNNLSSWGKMLPRDYDPRLYTSCFEYLPKRAIYSLQQQDGLRRDNWRNYLPLNYKDFGGVINTIKPLNATGALLLFENQAPIYFTGVDELKTEGGVKITIGDGGLFANNYKSLFNAEDTIGYGHSISSRAAINTPFGMFFVSQKSGKIFQTNGQSMDEISKLGMKFWFSKHLPSKFLEMFPEYPMYDNPVKGIGVQAIYDPTYELVYFTKRDLVPLKNNLHFDDPSGVPYYYCDEETEDTTYQDLGEDESKQPMAFAAAAVQQDPPAVAPPAPTTNTTATSSGTKEACVAPIDIAFVLDRTGSMSGPIRNLKTSISAIAIEAALKSNDDYRFALISVGETCGGPPINANLVSFAQNNLTDFQDKLNTVSAGGGCGEPEPTDVAIDSVLKGEVGAFRSNAIKMIIMITDARPSRGIDQFIRPASIDETNRIATLAKSKGVKIFPIVTGRGVPGPGNNVEVTTDIAEVHAIYASKTGGKANQSSSGVIGNIIADEIKNIPCPVTCSLGASVVEVKQGSKVTLTWTTTDAVSASILASAGLDVGSVPVNGTIDVYPTATTTFTLKASGENSETECTVTIKILPPPPKCPCAFDDPRCFQECGWTISYDPKAKIWVSFHSWTPTLMLPARNHFYTVDKNTLWKHNERWDSFCNFYGKDYPWEIEIPVSTPNQITTIRNIEFYMDVYKYYNDGNDFHHVLDEGFDRAIIFNSEQISGLLKLKVKGKNSPLDIIQVPVVDPVGINILYSKEENKFRFNQFWDITNDRGEFTGTKLPMWITDCNGYSKTINPDYVDYTKPMTEHKKFRHYANKIILRKNISKDNKMILKLNNTKNLNSPR